MGDAWGFLGETRPADLPHVRDLPGNRRLWQAVAAILAVVAAVGFWSPWRASQPEPRLNVDLGSDFDLGPVNAGLAISPDGTRIAYVAGPASGGPGMRL